MKKILLLTLICIPLLAICQTQSNSGKSRLRTLIWSDEFDGSGLPDEKK